MYKDVVVAEVELLAYRTVKKNYVWAMFNWIEKIATSKVFIVAVVAVVLLVVISYFGTKNQRKRKKRRKNTEEVVTDYSTLAR